MRKLLKRVIGAIAGFVYQRGVDLYRLADWLDDTDDETDVTEAKMAEWWVASEPTTTVSGPITITWNKEA